MGTSSVDFGELARVLRQSQVGSGRSVVTSSSSSVNTDAMTEALLRQRQQQLEQQAAITRGNASQQGDIQARLASQQGDIQARLQNDRLGAQLNLQRESQGAITARQQMAQASNEKMQTERITGTSNLSRQEAEQKKKQGLTNAALALAAFRGTSSKLNKIDLAGANKSLGI